MYYYYICNINKIVDYTFKLILFHDTNKNNIACVLALVEKERQRIEQLTAGWDDPTQVNWEDTRDPEDKTINPQSAPEEPEGPVYKCTALYSYTVSWFMSTY